MQSTSAANALPHFGAVLLAAGLATRLGAIASSTPKAMLRFEGVPFLKLVLSKLAAEGCTEAVVVVGHLAEVIEQYLEALPQTRMRTSAIRTATPGTGAALLVGLSALRQRQPFFCINADTVLDVCLPSVVAFHLEKKAELTAVLTALPHVPHWGAVAVDPECRIVDYDERDAALLPWQRPQLSSSKRMSNCGHYCFNPSSLERMIASGDDASSIELDIIPSLVARGTAYGFDNGDRLFLDFGTEQRFGQAQAITRQVLSLYLRETVPPVTGDRR